MQTNLNMNSKEKGLTVGELTLAIGALIVAGLIWTSIAQKEESQEISNRSTYHCVSKEIWEDINYQSLIQSNGIYNIGQDDDFSDSINRTREYFGPVDIQKLHIQFLDEYGRVVDFNNMDWSCELTFNSVYDWLVLF